MKTKQLLAASYIAAFAASAFAVDTDCPSKALQNTATQINLVTGFLPGQSFEGCTGPKSSFVGNTVSANPHWTMFGGTIGLPPNPGNSITTKCVPSTAPGPNYSRMMHATSNNANTGIMQTPHSSSTFAGNKMFSVYVFVNKGGVAIRAGTVGTTAGATSHSHKKGEWQQLRVCTASSVNQLVIRGTDPTGNDFYVDRAELYRTNP